MQRLPIEEIKDSILMIKRADAKAIWFFRVKGEVAKRYGK